MADPVVTANDFDLARFKANIQKVFSTFVWKNPNLLSLYEVTKLIKPDSEAYLGMQAIEVKKIIGSENRYQDFSSAFYPTNNSLKGRWQSIDAARLDNVTLPPISVYKIGEWYFVRDGNHRVSVARSEGLEFIDAEVVELSSNSFGLNGDEQSSVLRYLIEGGDLSLYGLSNAVTRTSQDIESYDSATELEGIGWKMAAMKDAEWEVLNR